MFDPNDWTEIGDYAVQTTDVKRAVAVGILLDAGAAQDQDAGAYGGLAWMRIDRYRAEVEAAREARERDRLAGEEWWRQLSPERRADWTRQALNSCPWVADDPSRIPAAAWVQFKARAGRRPRFDREAA